MLKIVIALGGNALGNSPKEQLELVKKNSSPIVDLVEEGHEVIIAHGNGPQVGMINNAFEESKKVDDNMPEVPFAECNAMSQGYIGYHLQNAIREELRKRDIKKSVASLVTQVVVDKDDPAFDNPTKPIGSFYTKEESEKITEETSYTFIEDAGRGYRRVVASPMPVDIVETDILSSLVENDHIVIAVGGGGIPVYENGAELVGLDAVIDKDFASSKLAEQVNADYLIILTAVDQVAINFGEENEEWLSEMDIGTTDKYIEEGHFAPGSMLPKIEAAKDFALSKKGRKALITSLEKASQGIKGETGTIIEDK
ncbi:MAG TPA: carbamate kinase [Tissierellaceae bacterium]|nr:carbamate kinase [Tissierellaceae bacterium]